MKKKIFIISLLLFVCFLITGSDVFGVTVYNETDFRNALSQQQSSIVIANSIDFYSAITINYNVTISAGSNDNAMRCKNKVSNFITVNSGKTLTLKGVVIDVRGSQGSAGINCIRIPSGAKMTFDGSLIDGGMSNTGLLIESGGAVTVTRGDFVYSKYGVRVQGTGTLSHSNSGSMSFWNNNTGLLYESTATCTMPNSDFHNNTVGMQVSKGTVNFNGTKIYSNSTGIYVTGGTVNMAGGSVYSNSSMGLNVSSGTMNLKGGNVYSNGSGTYVYGGTMNHTGGTIYSNTNHGAVVRNGTYNLAGGTIKNNGSQGVVLDNGYTGTFKMTSGTISGNTSNAIHTSFAGDKCIIHGGTVSGWVYLALADNYVTTNTSYPTLSVKPASYAFKRKLVKTDSNANANSEIGKVTMAASGSWYKYVDGQYIVVWTGGNVIVKCVDLGNNAVLSTETKNGTIGTNVTLTDPSVTGYALVSRPSTTTYTYAQADQTATYGFRKISNLVINYIDANTNEVLVTQTIELKEGDSYTATMRDIPGYQNTLKPTSETITMGRTDTELVYAYKKISDGVDVKYIDQVTGAEIADSEHKDGLEKDAYTTTEKTIDGYQLVVTPTNANGNMAVDLITVTYEYRKNSNVIVKFIDENHNTEIADQVSTKYKEGDTYTTTSRDIAGYQLTGQSDNTSGTVVRTDVEVTYKYKKISEGVDVKYIDQVTGNPITASVVKTGLENQEYTTEAKVVEGYELVTIPANANGKMTVGKITVKYEYRKLSEIVAKYVDINYNTEITEAVKQTLKEGDLYTTEQKSFDGYKLVNNPQNKTGVLARENIEVIYEYKKISDGVDVKYIDQVTGAEIADTEHKDGLEKDNYTTEAKKINGYELVKTPTNKNGEMTVELTTVTYEYRLVSKVITKHIDANTGKEIVEAIEDEYKEGDTYTTLPKDLIGYVITKTPDNTTGTIGRETIEVIYEYKKISDGLVVKYIDEITGDVMETETYSGNEEDIIELEEKSYEGYILTKRPAVSEIKLTVEPQEVRFYYKKLIDINIIAIDGITGEEIYTKVQSGVEGEKYETKPIELPGYEISKTPDNATGTYTRDNVNVIYEYKRISEGVIVTYVDKDTREVLDSKTINGFVGEEYATEKNTYEKYDFVEVIGNPKGKLEIDQIEVTYLYAKKTGIVEIVYADEEGNELLKEELTGRVDDEYTIEIKDITNYVIKEVIGETEGQYTVEKQIVKFVMEKLRGKVIVNLLDQNGNLIGQFEEEDFVGELFEIELPEKEGYYIDGDNKVKVEYIDGEIIINVNYIKIEEPPATGDLNIMMYITIALLSGILIKKVLLKNSKN